MRKALPAGGTGAASQAVGAAHESAVWEECGDERSIRGGSGGGADFGAIRIFASRADFQPAGI